MCDGRQALIVVTGCMLAIVAGVDVLVSCAQTTIETTVHALPSMLASVD